MSNERIRSHATIQEVKRAIMAKSIAWDVYLGGNLVDTVFFNTDCSAEYVLRALVEHDGYNKDIIVRKAK